MNLFKKYIAKYYPIWIILILEIVLFVSNYKPGTYLVGWDNLFPEFNFGLNIKRSIFSVWQEYRGLGLLDGMSHAANLIHHLFLWLLSFFLPQHALRYLFVFLMHLLGGLGMYLLISNIKYQISNKNEKITPLIGALFYQYNFATVQMFYLPFELFVVHFAALPWTFFLLSKYILTPTRRNLVYLFVLSLLVSPQAHVPSVFIVYAFAVLTMILTFVWRYKKKVLRAALIATLVIFVTNAFWGIPYFYSGLKNASVIANSKNNQMATDDLYFRNKAYGDFASVVLLKGLSLDFVQYDYKNQVSSYMLESWRGHMSKAYTSVVGWILFLVGIVGLIVALKRKRAILYPFAILWLVTFLLLGNDIPILNLFPTLLNALVPYFYNIFRFVFTKFSMLYVAMFSIFLAYGFSVYIDLVNERFRGKYDKVIFLIFSGLLFLSTVPSFRGNFLYENLKVKMPEQYFEMFSFFQKEDANQRIAILPAPWFWSWTQYSWGTIDSGFIWYGLPQPLLDRAFDPWSNYNENYYWELTKAIYADDKNLFLRLLDKYQIGWVIMDRDIIQPSTPRSLYLDKLDKFLDQSGKIRLAKSVGKLNIYKINLNKEIEKSIFIEENLPEIYPNFRWNNFDKAYVEYGNYITREPKNLRTEELKKETFDVYYPFRTLFTGRKQEELEFGIEDKGDYFNFFSTIPKYLEGSSLLIPPISKEEITEIDENNLDQTREIYPQVYLDNELLNATTDSVTTQQFSGEIPLRNIREGKLEVRVPKIRGFYSGEFSDTNSYKSKVCDQFNRGVYEQEIVEENGQKLLRLTSIGSSNCLDLDLPRLSQRLSYMVTVESRNIKGRSLLFAVTNKNSSRNEIETYLPKMKRVGPWSGSDPIQKSYFVIPPMELFGLGYNLHVDNISIGREKIVNDLGRLAVNPIPYNFLTSIKIVKNNQILWGATDDKATTLNVEHPNPSYYEVMLTSPQPSPIGRGSNQVLVLSQSYDDGWKAYELSSESLLLDSWYMKLFIPLFGKEIKDHVLVNNWENGWNISRSQLESVPAKGQGQSKSVVTIIYLPQYLEYLGFVMLGGLGLYLLLTFNRKRGKPDVGL